MNMTNAELIAEVKRRKGSWIGDVHLTYVHLTYEEASRLVVLAEEALRLREKEKTRKPRF
jgi:hypothetical protein